MTSCNVQPIMTNRIPFKRSELVDLRILGGIDCGGSLTKIVYVDKCDKNDLSKDNTSNFITITVALFPNYQFELAIQWMKDHGVFPEDSSIKIHATGAGCVTYCAIIQRILEREVLMVEEFLSQSRGAYHLLASVPLDKVTFPVEEPIKDYEVNNTFMETLKTQFLKHAGEEVTKRSDDEVLPCIFGFMGSAAGFTYISEKGHFRMLMGIPMAGKTFVSLGRCMLGTNDYKEIMQMAERGNRKNVDCVVEDLLGPTEDQTITGSLPILSMGKLAETGKDIKEFNKDDIAHSLVSKFAFDSLNAAIHMAYSEKIKNVIFGGNLFQGKVFRREFEYLRRYYNVDFINFKFMSNGHTGALGAMMSEPSDLAKFNMINED